MYTLIDPEDIRRWPLEAVEVAGKVAAFMALPFMYGEDKMDALTKAETSGAYYLLMGIQSTLEQAHGVLSTRAETARAAAAEAESPALRRPASLAAALAKARGGPAPTLADLVWGKEGKPEAAATEEPAPEATPMEAALEEMGKIDAEPLDAPRPGTVKNPCYPRVGAHDPGAEPGDDREARGPAREKPPGKSESA